MLQLAYAQRAGGERLCAADLWQPDAARASSAYRPLHARRDRQADASDARGPRRAAAGANLLGRGDGAVRAVLCEVCNTFGERHNYLLAHPDGRALADGESFQSRKAFHVSPFCEVKGDYTFRFHFGPERWLARIDYDDGTGEARSALLETSISGIAEPLSPNAVRGLMWRYRWFTLGVIVRIHWQAIKLWFKRVPYISKPQPPLQRTTR